MDIGVSSDEIRRASVHTSASVGRGTSIGSCYQDEYSAEMLPLTTYHPTDNHIQRGRERGDAVVFEER